MDLEKEFKEEFIEKYSEEDFKQISKLIDEMWVWDSDDIDQSFTEWSLILEKEKHSQLQYTYYINLQKEDFGDEINLEYENGINNGTVLRGYSMDGSGGVPCFREVEVLKDVVPDWDKIKLHFVKLGKISIEDEMSDDWKYKISQVFNHHKKDILDNLNKQNYDNYVTGGGTVKTDQYYKKIKEELEEKGFYYKTIYETVQVDINLV